MVHATASPRMFSLFITTLLSEDTVRMFFVQQYAAKNGNTPVSCTSNVFDERYIVIDIVLLNISNRRNKI